MRDKRFLLTLLTVAVVTFCILFGVGMTISLAKSVPAASTISVKQTSQTISASGSIHSQNEVTLHFQIGGKVIYLPFKQGDTVAQGQTIAQLDTYALQRSLQIQANTYEIAKNNNDQTQENQQATILEGQTRTTLDSTSHNNYNNITEAQVITDTVQRLVDNSLLTQNSAQLNVDLANYSLQLASLTAPFSGVLLSEDITTPNVNVTPLTSFSLVDPQAKVFRANVSASDIDFVSVGAKATITLDGQTKSMKGTVIKIYPQKQILQSGDEVYLVDIQTDGVNTGIFGQNGSVLITSNSEQSTLLVPSWTIVGHNMLWVWDGSHTIFKQVTVGATHADMTEILSGLSSTDKVITFPKTVIQNKYQLL